ncbi:ABC transporter substrate-binding protein [Gottfriedia sp. NPDC056225]|uniref:ABC transporter substrate-binding protein n=1 Tax=Gottfriedia sp. NPDC056225 TaxID=3345751 RepID=UPI0035E29847
MKKFLLSMLSVLVTFSLLAFNTSVSEAATKKITVKDFANRTVTFKKAPTRVAILSAGDLSTVKALGSKIVGRPTTVTPVDSNLKKITQIGTVYSPNYEKIVSVKPDVVIATTAFKANIKKVEKLGVKVVITSGASVNDIKKSITLLGKVLNKGKKAKVLTGKIDSRIKKFSKSKTNVRAVILFGSGSNSLVALPSSFSGDVLKKTGGVNIASSFSQVKDFPGYANLSTERIVKSNPDVIFMITHTDQKKTKAAMVKLMSSSSWKNLKAVKKKNVIFLPSDLFAASPGVKITNALDYMNKELLKVKAKKNK